MSEHGSANFDFSGVSLAFVVIPDLLEARLREAWSSFPLTSEFSPALVVTVAWIDDSYPGGRYSPKAMTSSLGSSQALFKMPEGHAHVGAEGAVTIQLLRAAGEDRAFFTLVNLVRACLAWILPSRGGHLLHSAGLVVGSRSFVLVGSANAGKSTWARLGESGGARVLSDDLVLLDREPCGTLVAVGAPLFSTHRADYGKGRWPVAAIFYPEHAQTIETRPIPTLLCQARFLANLPFISEGIERDPRIAKSVDRIVSEIPQRVLRFGLDSDVSGFLANWKPAPSDTT